MPQKYNPITLYDKAGNPVPFPALRGKDYVLTEEDETHIAEKVAEMVSAPVTPQDYGAKGDGSTDDTTAFQDALANNRTVFVPGGTYKLSDTLVIRQNCCLELSQDTVLNFTQTTGNCIELRSSATLRGNHGIIDVPYAFTGNAVVLDADYDDPYGVLPYKHWTPQWKHGRYVYDVCITKGTYYTGGSPNGLHYSYNGTCSGTALYMHTDGTKALPYMWGVNASGIRIAGAFTYGINVVNVDDPNDSVEDDAWNHDMRIEAVIEGCETGVSMKNCNGAYLNVTVQPIKAENGTPYAKWGVYLDDCRFVDMSSARVWDWTTSNTLLGTNSMYQHIALIGNCRGLLLSDFLCSETSAPIRDLIYTDRTENFDTMSVLQERGDANFKTVNSKPYYKDKQLALESDLYDIKTSVNTLESNFDVDAVKDFNDVLPTATDGSGNIFGGVGYVSSGNLLDANGAATSSDATKYGCTGFIPVKSGDTVYVENVVIGKGDDKARFVLYDSSFNKAGTAIISTSNASFQSGDTYFFDYTPTTNGFKVVVAANEWGEPTNTAYFRFAFLTSWLTGTPMVAVNEEIKYTMEGFLADGIKVKGNNILVYSPGGQAFKLTINDDGVLTPVKLES